MASIWSKTKLMRAEREEGLGWSEEGVVGFGEEREEKGWDLDLGEERKRERVVVGLLWR